MLCLQIITPLGENAGFGLAVNGTCWVSGMKRPSYYLIIFRGWRYLMARLLLSAVLSYVLILWLTEIGVLSPARTPETTTAGIRYVGRPLLEYGMRLGIDEALIIFLSNSLVAMLIVSALSLTAHGVPGKLSARFPFFVKATWKRPHADVLRLLPGCRDISDPRLRLTYFCLFVTPMLSMIFFGVMIGSVLASGQYVFGSLVAVLALIVPHGVFEVPMIVLAAAIPFSGYLLVQKGVASGRPNGVIREINRFKSSFQLQVCLLVVFSFLWVSAVVESIFTQQVANWLAHL